MQFEEWAFLDEWCGAMRELFTATDSSATVWQWGPDYSPALQFTIVPPRSKKLTSIQRLTQLKTLREGLALFAAVAWINVDALISLLKSKGVCQPREEVRHHEFMMAELPMFVELEATRKLYNDRRRGFSWVHEDLVSLCCQLDQRNTSQAFQEAWTKVEELSRPKAHPLRGLTIPVRVVIGKPEYSKRSGSASQQVWSVLRNTLSPDQVQWGWFKPELGSSFTFTRASRSSFYASFVVDAVNARNASTSNGTSAAFMNLLAEMGREVQFSAINVCFMPCQDSLKVCRMIASLFCTDNTYVAEQSGVDFAAVSFQDESGLEMDALCSALAVTRSCRSVTFTLGSYDTESNVKIWGWITHAFFSNRARSRSCVKQVTIYNAWLDANTLRSLSRILTSVHSEQELFIAAKATGRTSNSVLDSSEYYLRKKSGIKVTEEGTGKVISWNSADIFHQGKASGVVLVNPDDDESTEWVDVLVPGVGFCQVQRSNLVVSDNVRISEVQPDLELELQFSGFSNNRYLLRLLRLVGGHLRSLWIELPLWRDEGSLRVSGILEACPYLQELTLHNDIISSDELVRACDQHNAALRRLDCHFDDIRVLAAALTDESKTLTRTLRWLHCDFLTIPGMSSTEALQVLTQMLAGNRVLRYLTVVVDALPMEMFRNGLKQFDLQEVEEVEEMPIACKLAFLSVFHLDAVLPPLKKQTADRVDHFNLYTPDIYVTPKIFAFAAKHATRKVNVIDPSR